MSAAADQLEFMESAAALRRPAEGGGQPASCYDGCGEPTRVPEEACEECTAARTVALSEMIPPPPAGRKW